MRSQFFHQDLLGEMPRKRVVPLVERLLQARSVLSLIRIHPHLPRLAARGGAGLELPVSWCNSREEKAMSTMRTVDVASWVFRAEAVLWMVVAGVVLLKVGQVWVEVASGAAKPAETVLIQQYNETSRQLEWVPFDQGRRQWTGLDTLGYGVVRRLHDVEVWVLAALAFTAGRLAVGVEKMELFRRDRTWFWCGVAASSLIFVGLYLFAARTDGRAFFTQHAGMVRAIQWGEGVLHLTAMGAAGLMFFSTVLGIHRLRRDPDDRAAELIGGACLTTLLAAFLTYTAWGMFQETAPVTKSPLRAIGRITLYSGPFLTLFLYAMMRWHRVMCMRVVFSPRLVEVVMRKR